MTDKRYRWHVIYNRIKNIENPIGAEIGVFRGECSAHLLEMHSGLKLYMIDMWSPDTYKGKGDDAATEPYRAIYEKECSLNQQRAIETTAIYEDRAAIFIISSIEAAEIFPDNFLDFVFLDASHKYEDVKADIMAWKPKVKQGGFLFLHDLGLFEGVTKAVNELFLSFEIDDDYMAVIQL